MDALKKNGQLQQSKEDRKAFVKGLLTRLEGLKRKVSSSTIFILVGNCTQDWATIFKTLN